jgi:uncharacterized protein
MTGSSYQLAWVRGMAEIAKEAWDEMASALPTPFYGWDWLHNLEASGSITATNGWQPCHLTVERDGDLVAAAPLYLKGHSQGEFVFDHQWADLASRMGIDYYPKLLGMSPVTPAVGYRFLVRAGEDERALTEMMVGAIDQFCRRNQIVSCNFLHVDPEWKPIVESCGFSPWAHHNAVWHNQGFETYEDYLGLFNANQRRNIRREMKAVETAGLTMKTFTGDEIPDHFFPLMYQFYSDHCDKFGWWGSKYLTRTFFLNLNNFFRDNVLFVAALPEGSNQPVGMSFCIHKGDRLYGRYWGCFQEYDCLHFNACYYTPIAWGIEHGIQSFDPGAGGSHKKRRGFPATPYFSMHRFYNDRFGSILKNYLNQVNAQADEEIEAINNELPFKKTDVSLSE